MPAIAELTDGAVAREADLVECLAWWEREGEKWIISPLETKGQTARQEAGAVQQLEEIP